MSTLLEIETAAEARPPEQKEELFLFLAVRLRSATTQKARLVQEGNDLVLEAPTGAPPMTTRTVKKLLEDWP
jgi:hypothetical protein